MAEQEHTAQHAVVEPAGMSIEAVNALQRELSQLVEANPAKALQRVMALDAQFDTMQFDGPLSGRMTRNAFSTMMNTMRAALAEKGQEPELDHVYTTQR